MMNDQHTAEGKSIRVDDTGKWDIEIKPQGRFWDLQLGELWRYRDLMVLLVKRDFIAQYKQTILGPLWHIIQPALTTAMFLLVFSRIASIPTDGIHPIPFYMSGIILWNYFSICLATTANTFVANAAIFGKVYFPRLVMPLSVIVSNLVRFLIQFILLGIVLIWFHSNGQEFSIGAQVLLIPIILLITAGIALGAGLIVSSLTTKYRDFSVLLSFVIQLGMYATPIAYPLSYVINEPFGHWIAANPLSPLAEGFRFALFGSNGFAWPSLWYSCGVMVIFLLLGALIFNKVQKSFMDTV